MRDTHSIRVVAYGPDPEYVDIEVASTQQGRCYTFPVKFDDLPNIAATIMRTHSHYSKSETKPMTTVTAVVDAICKSLRERPEEWSDISGWGNEWERNGIRLFRGYWITVGCANTTTVLNFPPHSPEHKWILDALNARMEYSGAMRGETERGLTAILEALK